MPSRQIAQLGDSIDIVRVVAVLAYLESVAVKRQELFQSLVRQTSDDELFSSLMRLTEQKLY